MRQVPSPAVAASVLRGARGESLVPHSYSSSYSAAQRTPDLYLNSTALPGHVTANSILKEMGNDVTVYETGVSSTTSKIPQHFLSDASILEQMPLFVSGKWIDRIYVPICATLGIVGNVLAFCVLVSARSTGSTTYVYMAALSLSDSMVQVVNILWFVRKFPGHETIKDGTCQFVFFLMHFGMHSSVVVMVTMTIERYLAICYPLRAATWFTVRRAVVIVAMETLIIMGLNLQHLIIREMYVDEGSGNEYCRTIPGFTTFYAQKIWPWIDGVLYCYGPLLCLCVFNVLIVRQVRASRSFQSKTTLSDTTLSTDQRSSHTKTSSKMTTQESQLTRMLLLVTTAFLVCVGPMGVVIVVERYFWETTTNSQYALYYFIRTILNNLDYTNHALNFYLYCLSGKRFRQELVNTFSCLCPASMTAAASGKAVRMATQSCDSYASGSVATVATEASMS